MQNEYQVTKTVRFGLTLKYSDKKNLTHQDLGDLVKTSQEYIQENSKSKREFSEKDLVESVSECFEMIKRHVQQWENVCSRIDQISLTKDYYKIIAKKANFQALKINSQLVKISSLRSKYYDSYQKDYIERYWQKNLEDLKNRIYNFKAVLTKYEDALDVQNKAHTKPHLVDFRKDFLSICNLVCVSLNPLVNDSIVFAGIEKLSNEKENDCIKEFASKDKRDERRELLAKIDDIRADFEASGNYVRFGRVTLNKFTAKQKPQKFDDEIKETINYLKIQEFINTFDNNAFDLSKSIDDIEKMMTDRSKSLIQRVQIFKCKAIPASVRVRLADYLQKNNQSKKVIEIFEAVGTPLSPAFDYSKLTNDDEKQKFSLEKYPVKLAFDYAWENYARMIKGRSVNFPEEQSKAFLQKFDVDENNKNFKLYADLLFIKDEISMLNNPNNTPNDKEARLKKLLNEINIVNSLKEKEKHAKAIEAWLNKTKKEKEAAKSADTKEYKDYVKAMQTIGQLRGSQKNFIKKYKKLTEVFKTLSCDFGKKFADLRDKFREEAEDNKISHAGIIIEDSKQDRYLLLQELDSERANIDVYDTKEDLQTENFTTFCVKSLTSKTLNKLIKNSKKYETFHSRCHVLKEDLDTIKTALIDSDMAKEQNWAEFDFNSEIQKCKSYEELTKKIDQKAHILMRGKISKETIQNLVLHKKCLLLPIVNQDLTSKTRKAKNQFSKDWNMMFDPKIKEYRLHPEFAIFYRQPTPDYPNPGEKRYSRFTMVANMQCEIFPKSNYVSKKEQIENFNNEKKQKQIVKKFNNSINLKNDFYVIGIDRGIKQLATLCVLNSKGEIQGDFEIYTREFNKEKKRWEHTLSQKRGILDLSNLRVETTICINDKEEEKKVLVDLSSIKTKNGENLQTTKLKQLSYIRKLQYQMQSNAERVMTFAKNNTTDEDIKQNIKDLITPYKEGANYTDLPMDEIKSLLERFKNCRDDERRKLVELDAAEKLKSSIVANMVGVVAFLLERYNYKAIISLENLCRAFLYARDGLTGQMISSTKDPSIDFKEQENLVLAGVGTYQFFEMQLLKKLFKIQNNSKIIHLVPPFRAKCNYEHIVRRDKKSDGDEFVNYPFGIVRFVDPKNTSKKCPKCEKTNVTRRNNVIRCKECNFTTANFENENSHLRYITNGDDNGAYHIAKKLPKIKKL